MNFTLEDAVEIGEAIGIEWDSVEFTPEDFLTGLEVELEHGTEVSEDVNVTNDDPLATGQIAWVHLMETPLYYEEDVGLPEMEDRLEEGAEPYEAEASVKKYAYVLDEIVEKHPDYISPEVEKMAMNFIQQAEKNAKQHSDMFDDEAEAIEYLEDALNQGPNLGSIKSGDLLELLQTNPVLGAIPLVDLKADNFLRGDNIDVYDYLEAALKHLIERVSLLWLKGERIDYSKEYQPEEEKPDRSQDTQPLGEEEGTAIESPAAKKKQQMGASVGRPRRFATFRINGKDQ